MKFYKALVISHIILFSCSSEQQDQQPEQENQVIISEWKKPSGNPDLPLNDSMITSVGMGKIILGDKLKTIDLNYPENADMEIYRNGKTWEGKKITLKDQTWIIAESINTVGIISFISTNSPSLKTKNNIGAGMKLSTAAQSDSLVYDSKTKTIFSQKEGVTFTVRNQDEKFIFSTTSPKPENAVIATISISCEDC
ncbi:MAG: hypothetical protein ACK40G_10800 [Cytophagaceae bacterium]